MDALKDFYDFYRPLQRKYDLQMFYRTNSKEAKITIRWRGKELVKVAEETTEACFIRAKRELEERMKKEVDGVVVETKSILTALKIIKTVCEDNDCLTCPFGKIENEKGLCLVKDTIPSVWNINKPNDVWRALE